MNASTEISSAAALPARAVTLAGFAGRPVRAKVTEIGTGPTFVFLHGLVGLNEHWDEVAMLVRDRVRCVMLELPLLELTGQDCSVQGVAELTKRFLIEHVPEPAVLVGNSFGGHVALHSALGSCDASDGQVRGLVLTGSSGLIERSTVKAVETRPSREWLEDKIGELFYDRRHVRESDIERAHRELNDRKRARAMIRLSRTARKNHLGAQISGIDLPVLLIWGREDVVTPPEAAREFERLLPDARLEWFDNCGHVPMVERADAFASRLVAFAEELDANAGG
ncbi:MAG: alpha/beta hydrolase [Planctomycetota bacterium]